MNWQVPVLCIGAYLLGSVPSAFLAGRWLRGIDIREHWSGNVGGSNTWHSVAHWAIVPVGLFDVGKAALPAWLALDPLDMGYAAAIGAGLAAVIGHAWSIYLHFTGGRALSCILGTLLVVFPAGVVFEASLMVLGLFLHTEALFALLGLLALPVLSVALGMSPVITLGCIGMVLITAVKRVEANRKSLPSGPDKWRVVLCRLLFDRDQAPSAENRQASERRAR